jgi:hypothetical protein
VTYTPTLFDVMTGLSTFTYTTTPQPPAGSVLTTADTEAKAFAVADPGLLASGFGTGGSAFAVTSSALIVSLPADAVPPLAGIGSAARSDSGAIRNGAYPR